MTKTRCFNKPFLDESPLELLGFVTGYLFLEDTMALASCNKRMLNAVPESATCVSVKNTNTLKVDTSILQRFSNVKRVNLACLCFRDPIDFNECRHAGIAAVQFLCSFKKLTYSEFVGRNIHGDLQPWFRSLVAPDMKWKPEHFELIGEIIREVCYAYQHGCLPPSVQLFRLLPHFADGRCLMERATLRPCSTCALMYRSFPPHQLVTLLWDSQLPCFTISERFARVQMLDPSAIDDQLVHVLDCIVTWKNRIIPKRVGIPSMKEVETIIRALVRHGANPQNPEIREVLTQSSIHTLWNHHIGKRVMTKEVLQFLQEMGMDLYESDFNMV